MPAVRVSSLCLICGLADNTLLLDQMLDEVLRWLSALDCTEKHNDMHKLRQAGTCTWFPNTDAYEKWRAGGCQFLWLNGKGVASDTLRVVVADPAHPSTCP